jgi:hypothetical protein
MIVGKATVSDAEGLRPLQKLACRYCFFGEKDLNRWGAVCPSKNSIQLGTHRMRCT